jgi:hypothetical protein
MILAFHGLPGVGKDTAADYLVSKYGFTKMAFGDAIYRELSDEFSVSADLIRSREWKVTPQSALALRNCADSAFTRMVIAKEMPQADYNISPFCTEAYTCPRTSRFIAQQWATEYKRAHFGDDYWVNQLRIAIGALPYNTNIVITDLRHLPEMELLFEYNARWWPKGFRTVHMHMDGATHTGHDSDDMLPRKFIDHRITNIPGDLDKMRADIDQLVYPLLQKGL